MTRYTFKVGPHLIIFLVLPAVVSGQFPIRKCVAVAYSSGVLTGDDWWTGKMRGLDPKYFQESQDRTRVLTLSYKGKKLSIGTCSYSETIFTRLSGCLKACKSTPQLNTVDEALNILTTWVLPVIALISNLPFENGRHGDSHLTSTRLSRWRRLIEFMSLKSIMRKLRRSDAHFIPRTNFFEPFVNWMGSPQTALAATLSNIQLLNRATAMVKKEKKQLTNTSGVLDVQKRKDYILALRNVLFVICCVGQYEFLGPDDGDKNVPDEGTKNNLDDGDNSDVDDGDEVDSESQYQSVDEGMERKRNRALLLGLMLPLCDPAKPCPPGLMELIHESGKREQGMIEWESREMKEMVASTKFLLTLLSRQLHLLRRRGMYPLAISIAWFFAAFSIGVYQSFRQVGNYTVAHSLAVGLLLSWLPVLVLMSVADRNPNGVERCTVWSLCSLEAVCR
jgi:hypothetical protein